MLQPQPLRALRFVKPDCDNVLQHETALRSSDCNTLSHSGLTNVNVTKIMLYLHCYISSFPPQVFTIQNNYMETKFRSHWQSAVTSVESFISIITRSDIVWCLFHLRRITQTNAVITSRRCPERAVMEMKPSADRLSVTER